jgi:UDP-N-acetylglucosamine 2-epimerase (non-hydrolysing)
MPRKIAAFMGTRPEAVKFAPVIASLRQEANLKPIVIYTGQHREMIDQVIELFGIQVDVELNSMEPNQSLATLTSRMIERIDNALAATTPDFAIVQGDTATVLCAAIASFYRRIPIGHVEAGLRTGDIQSPFPEEANRRLTTPLVNLHFAPAETARQALLSEGVAAGTIEVTGNTVIDALLTELKRQANPENADLINSELSRLLGDGWQGRPLILVTGHRRENFGEGFRQICEGLGDIAKLRPDALIVLSCASQSTCRERGSPHVVARTKCSPDRPSTLRDVYRPGECKSRDSDRFRGNPGRDSNAAKTRARHARIDGTPRGDAGRSG